MKKILILAYDFPPYVSVGGLRPYSWCHYFHEYGLYPVVVTRQWENRYGNASDYIAPGACSETIVEESEWGMIIRTPYKPNLANRLLLKYGNSKYRYPRKIISAFYEICQWFFPVGSKIQLYREAKRYLQQNRIDCILATGEPFILFKYASKLSRRFHIPWIADYRDPWSQSKLRSVNFFLRSMNTFFERKYLKNCAFVTTVSEFCKIQIASNVKQKDFHIIPNGFDNKIQQDIENIEQNKEVLSIAFAGTMYNWHPVDSFLRVLAQFVKEKKPAIRLDFYGVNNEEDIRHKLLNLYPGIKEMVNIYPGMPNSGVMAELAKHNLLLLFNDYAFMGTKIYDYLAVKRVILLCYTNDKEANELKQKYYDLDEIAGVSSSLQADLIRETHSGIVLEDLSHLYRVLAELYDEFVQKGRIACHAVGVEHYSRKKQTEKLSVAITGILE